MELSLFSDLVGLAGKEAITGEPEVNDCIIKLRSRCQVEILK